MDRRRRKPREAIFEAFAALSAQRNYSRIAVQEITDRAGVGRATCYVHLETKEALLQTPCQELFGRIVDTAKRPRAIPLRLRGPAGFGVPAPAAPPTGKDGNILGLPSGESSEPFLRYFRDSLRGPIQPQFIAQIPGPDWPCPRTFWPTTSAAALWKWRCGGSRAA